MHKCLVIMLHNFVSKFAIVAIVVAALVCSCTPHKWFIVNSEGILSYDRNKGTFELLWTNKTSGYSPDSGTVKVDSILFAK